MTTRYRRQRRQAALIIETTQPGAAIALLRRDAEPRVTHPERRKDAPVQHRAQRRTLEACDQEPEHVCRETVMKSGAWLIDQRQRRQARDPRVRRERVVDGRPERLRMGTSDRAAMKLAIRQTGA